MQIKTPSTSEELISSLCQYLYGTNRRSATHRPTIMSARGGAFLRKLCNDFHSYICDCILGSPELNITHFTLDGSMRTFNIHASLKGRVIAASPQHVDGHWVSAGNKRHYARTTGNQTSFFLRTPQCGLGFERAHADAQTRTYVQKKSKNEIDSLLYRPESTMSLPRCSPRR